MAGSLGLSIPVSEVLDPQLWRDRYAWGTDLGQPIGVVGLEPLVGGQMSQEDRTALRQYIGNLPDHVITYHLRCALSEASLKLDIPMELSIIKGSPVDAGLRQGVDYDEEMLRLQWNREDAESFYRINVPGPVLSIQRVRLYSYDSLILEISEDRGNQQLIRLVDRKQGEVHLLPFITANGAMTELGLLVQDRFGSLQPVFSLRGGFSVSNIPDAWSIDYTKGPLTEDGRPGELELVIANWIALRAMRPIITFAISPLSSIGSSSVSIDGVSQSVGLTSSATTTLVSGIEYLIKQMEESIDWKHLRRVKKGIPVMFI